MGPRPPEQAAEIDVEKQAAFLVPSGALVIAPPTLDGFRSTALRPDVVEFGSIRLGKGDAEWRQRMLDLTGDARVLDPHAFPLGTADRLGSAPVPTVTATDATSGLAAPPRGTLAGGPANGAGPYTNTASATDLAGNTPTVATT